MNKVAHIIYVNYLTPDGARLSIGGVQTYISNLVLLLDRLGYNVVIYQKSTIRFEKKIDNNIIYGIPTKYTRGVNIGRVLFKECYKRFQKNVDLLIFGCDNYICSTHGLPFIAIQHGITWDKPINQGNRIYWMLKKFYRACLTIHRVEKATALVCVDNNFINWYRAIVSKPRVRLFYVPNFADVFPQISKPNDGIIRIIFARRFFDYRGTRVFTHASKKLLQEFNNIEITIAGEGPDEEWMKNELSGFRNVRFISYRSEDSLKIHADKHIAVVPTLGSEGTSLSLLEAMSAQCAVICTNVGGMTNVILNGYNGILINPDASSLYYAMRELIINVELRTSISQIGYETLRRSFSKDLWLNRWTSLLRNLNYIE